MICERLLKEREEKIREEYEEILTTKLAGILIGQNNVLAWIQKLFLFLLIFVLCHGVFVSLS